MIFMQVITNLIKVEMWWRIKNMRKKENKYKKTQILVKNMNFMLHFNDICTKKNKNLMHFAIAFFKKKVYNIREGGD